MIFLPKYEPFCTKLIFYRIPKNASTSVYDQLGSSNIIKQNEKLINCNADQNLYKRWFSPTHLKPEELKKITGLNLNDFFSFCIVRNPWDRVVSMYFFCKKHDLHSLYGIDEDYDFNFFCKTLNKYKNDKYFIACHSQSQWAKRSYAPSRILRFENIQEEFKQMVEDIGLQGVSKNLPHKNKTNHKHYSSYYTKETIDLIEQIFIEDIKNFGYSFENIEENNDDGEQKIKLKI